MTMDRDALVERVAEAIVSAGYNPATARDIARAALAVIEPAVREECARVVDAKAAERTTEMRNARAEGDRAGDRKASMEATTLIFLAAAIRALPDDPA